MEMVSGGCVGQGREEEREEKCEQDTEVARGRPYGCGTRAGHVRVGWRCESSERQSDKVGRGEELLARHGKVFSAARGSRRKEGTGQSGRQRQAESRDRAIAELPLLSKAIGTRASQKAARMQLARTATALL
jgi:hypothetical protein